jgi:pimeloyl-ACP methyl ester carboxylesterase
MSRGGDRQKIQEKLPTLKGLQIEMKFAYLNGARIAYEDTGEGPDVMLLVHGWGCDHTALNRQIEFFRHSHRVIAVDLRGHGASDAPQQDYTVAGFADDLALLCATLHFDSPVVVAGHSMGGTVALELAAYHEHLLSAVVLIDSVILPDPALVKALLPVARALNGDGYREALHRAVSTLFLSTDNPRRKARLLASMAGIPQHVLASSFRNHVTEYDATPAARQCRVPVAYIAAAGRNLADLERFRALCPQLMAAQTLGSGHFSPLEVPDQINFMIERFCELAENQCVAGLADSTAGTGDARASLQAGSTYLPW